MGYCGSEKFYMKRTARKQCVIYLRRPLYPNGSCLPVWFPQGFYIDLPWVPNKLLNSMLMVPTCTEDSLWFLQGSCNVLIRFPQDDQMAPTAFHWDFLVLVLTEFLQLDATFPQYKSTVFSLGFYSNLTSFIKGFLKNFFGINVSVSVAQGS